MQRKFDGVALLPLQWNFKSECGLLMAWLWIAFPLDAEKSVVSDTKVTIVDVGSHCCTEEVCQFTQKLVRLAQNWFDSCCDNPEAIIVDLMLSLLLRL